MAVEQLDDGRIVELAKIIATDIQLPTEIQSRRTQTIQTHNAVSLPATTGSSASAWIDTDGFNEIAITMLNDATTNTVIDIGWSNDGITMHGLDFGTATNVKYKALRYTTVARYVRVVVTNTDASAHTVSAWAYLKA